MIVELRRGGMEDRIDDGDGRRLCEYGEGKELGGCSAKERTKSSVIIGRSVIIHGYSITIAVEQ
jgi:hypothetical protein